MELFEELRIARHIDVHSQIFPNQALTVFVGIFNGSSYISSTLNQLLSQKSQDFHILVVDNFSSDTSWNLLQKWKEFFPGRLTLIRNPMNLGAHGSIAFNYDYVQTPWITFVHQDDYYGPDHIKTLLESIKKTGKEVIAISTDMGAISSSGKLIGPPARAIWFQEKNDQFSSFLTNLRTHAIPVPCTAFSTQVFKDALSPWHSTSFPDTEMLLKMVSHGIFLNIEKETMQYQEHEMSESHSINQSDRNFGVGVALCRVFASTEFISLIKDIPEIDRTDFSTAVNRALVLRLGDSSLAAFVSHVADESMTFAWGYSEPTTLMRLIRDYRSINAKFSAEMLSSIFSLISGDGSDGTANPDLQSRDLSSLLVENRPAERVKKSNISKFYVRWGYKVPYRFRKLLLKSLYRVRFKTQKNHPLNLKWKND